MPDGTVKVLVEGITRVKITDYNDSKYFITCSYEKVSDQINKEEDLMQTALSAIKKLEKLTSINKKTGARGLRSILESVLLKTMFELPSMENVKEVIVDSGAAKGQSQPIIVHSKNAQKDKDKDKSKTSAA